MALPFNPVFEALSGSRRRKQHGLEGVNLASLLSKQHIATLPEGGAPTGEPLAALRAAINAGGPEEFLGPGHPHRMGGPQQVEPHERLGGHAQEEPHRMGGSIPPGEFQPHVPGIHWFGPGGSGVAYPGQRPSPLLPTRMAGSRGLGYTEPIRRLAALAGAAHGVTPGPNLVY